MSYLYGKQNRATDWQTLYNDRRIKVLFLKREQELTYMG